MTNWANVVEGKIALATRNIEPGMNPDKESPDARIPLRIAPAYGK